MNTCSPLSCSGPMATLPEPNSATSCGALKMPTPMTMPATIIATSVMDRLARGAAWEGSDMWGVSGGFGGSCVRRWLHARHLTSRAAGPKGVALDRVALELAAKLRRPAAEVSRHLDGLAVQPAGHRRGHAVDDR